MQALVLRHHIESGRSQAGRGRRAAVYARLLGTTMLTSAAILAAPSASANPSGGTVAAGQASISGGAGQTTITQDSPRAVINWTNFSIDRGETTRFVQPNTDSITLNRVTGGSRSDIHGMLQANGNVWLINPNGVLIGPSAQINVNGFLASTADIADIDFMAGRYNFSVPSPDPKAEVINQGTISIGATGLAALVAPHVRNDGVISGYLGQVVLAGTPTFTLDLQGDGLIQFAVGSQVAGDAMEPGRALVETPGVIAVEGGRVLLTASAAAGVVDTVINMDGAIEARSVAMREGAIVLDGGGNGVVQVAGSLDAGAIGDSGAGGAIDVLGDRVLVLGSAVIDASGPDGGGTIHIGGDLRGQGPRREASATVIARGAKLGANATRAGDGGQVVAWGDRYLGMAGDIAARGGPDGGNGGFVETSSKGGMAVTGRIDTAAPAGKAGTWLLDPVNVRILAEGTETNSLPVNVNDPPAEAVVLTGTIERAADVLIEASQNITVEDSIFKQTPGAVRLHAGNDLSIFFSVSVNVNGELTLRGQNISQAGSSSITALGVSLQAATAGSNATLVSDAGGSNNFGILSVASAPGAGASFSTVEVLNDGGDLTIGTVDGIAGIQNAATVRIESGDNLTVDAPSEASQLLRLTAGEFATIRLNDILTAPTVLLAANQITDQPAPPLPQLADIFATTLGLIGRQGGEGSAPVITLDGANQVSNLSVVHETSGAPLGPVSFNNVGDLTVVGGTIDGEDFQGRRTLAEGFTFNVDGRVTVAKSIEATGEGTTILVNANSFTNQIGDAGLVPDAFENPGRYLVYSQNPQNDTRGEPTGTFEKQYDVTFPDLPPNDDGQNFFLYSIAPTLVITANNVSRPVDTANPDPLTATVTVVDADGQNLGYPFDGDDFNAQIADILPPTTDAIPASPVGDYPIVFASFEGPAVPDAAALGYAEQLNDGTLTVFAPVPPTPNPNPLCNTCITTVETQDVDTSDLIELEQRPERPLLLPEPRSAGPKRSIRGGDPQGLHANDGNRELWTPQGQKQP